MASNRLSSAFWASLASFSACTSSGSIASASAVLSSLSATFTSEMSSSRLKFLKNPPLRLPQGTSDSVARMMTAVPIIRKGLPGLPGVLSGVPEGVCLSGVLVSGEDAIDWFALKCKITKKCADTQSVVVKIGESSGICRFMWFYIVLCRFSEFQRVEAMRGAKAAPALRR